MPVNVAGGRRWLDASRTGTGTAGTAALALRAWVMELRQALVLAMVQPALPAPPALVVGLAGAAAAWPTASIAAAGTSVVVAGMMAGMDSRRRGGAAGVAAAAGAAAGGWAGGAPSSGREVSERGAGA